MICPRSQHQYKVTGIWAPASGPGSPSVCPCSLGTWEPTSSYRWYCEVGEQDQQRCDPHVANVPGEGRDKNKSKRQRRPCEGQGQGHPSGETVRAGLTEEGTLQLNLVWKKHGGWQRSGKWNPVEEAAQAKTLKQEAAWHIVIGTGEQGREGQDVRGGAGREKVGEGTRKSRQERS